MNDILPQDVIELWNLGHRKDPCTYQHMELLLARPQRERVPVNISLFSLSLLSVSTHVHCQS